MVATVRHSSLSEEPRGNAGDFSILDEVYTSPEMRGGAALARGDKHAVARDKFGTLQHDAPELTWRWMTTSRHGYASDTPMWVATEVQTRLNSSAHTLGL